MRPATLIMAIIGAIAGLLAGIQALMKKFESFITERAIQAEREFKKKHSYHHNLRLDLDKPQQEPETTAGVSPLLITLPESTERINDSQESLYSEDHERRSFIRVPDECI
jgi:hypothetical protein